MLNQQIERNCPDILSNCEKKWKDSNKKTNFKQILLEKFTPIRIEVGQASLFYDRIQKLEESVNDYFDALNTLFAKVLPCLVKTQ